MKVTHVLIGAGAVVAAVVIYKKFVAAQPTKTPTEQVGSGVGDIIDGARNVYDGITSIFRRPASSPTRGPTGEAAQPIGTALNWDADGDQNGLTPTGTLELRTFS